MERITVCLTRHDADYGSIMTSLRQGLAAKGQVSPEIAEFVADCIDQMGIGHITIPLSDADITIDELHIALRPQLAIISHARPAPDFRDRVIKHAVSAGLTAVDNQNGLLFVPPDPGRKPWWKFWT